MNSSLLQLLKSGANVIHMFGVLEYSENKTHTIGTIFLPRIVQITDLHFSKDFKNIAYLGTLL